MFNTDIMTVEELPYQCTKGVTSHHRSCGRSLAMLAWLWESCRQIV